MEQIADIFRKYGFELTDVQAQKFEQFFCDLIKKNEVLNLTTITEKTEVLLKHFLDSCLPAKLLSQNAKVLDVGSGAGFPAIPLKILRDDLNFIMLDSVLKKVNFLNEEIENLNLKNIMSFHTRAEDFAKENRENFDFVVARAVAPLCTLLEYLVPFLKIGGKALIYKSQKLDEELLGAEKALKILGAEIEEILPFKIEEIGAERKILVLKKVKQTPTKYPRGKNLPRKMPIV